MSSISSRWSHQLINSQCISGLCRNAQDMVFRKKKKALCCLTYSTDDAFTNPELPKFTFGGVLPNTIPLNGHFNHFLFCQFDCPQLVSRTSSNCERKGDDNLTMVHPIQILIASKATFWGALFLENEIGKEGGRTIFCHFMSTFLRFHFPRWKHFPQFRSMQISLIFWRKQNHCWVQIYAEVVKLAITSEYDNEKSLPQETHFHFNGKWPVGKYPKWFHSSIENNHQIFHFPQFSNS